MPVAMARIEDEFRNILLSITSPVKAGTDPSSTYTDSEYSSYSQERTNSNSEEKLTSSEATHDLRRIAERMIAAGYSRECVEAYVSVRKTCLDESCENLGIEKLSSKNIQRLEWKVQEEMIRRWIHAAKISVHVLFEGEKRLSEQIFKGLGTDIDDACFMETIKDYAIHLFNFVEAISSSRKSPEKLFKILDLYDVLSDLLPDIETIFGSKSGEFIRSHAVEILSSLSEAAGGILSEFEKAVLGELTKVPVPGGSIHPLTRYASPLQLHVVWIVVILKCNLENKSKQYKDAALAHLFMMNNVHYIVQKIKESVELREMIGDDYLNNLIGEYRLAAANYQKSALEKVLVLRVEGLRKVGSFLFGVSKLVLRQRVKAFNAKFKEVHRTWSTWLVPDAQLREDLRISTLQVLIPVYTSFLEKYRSRIESGKRPKNYITYTVEDLETAVMDMFLEGQ
ncbi:hypothetical protein Pfo_012305 [Paulownia fortunei]|nr:hypothetical protein Pfo_012305 [Paulownia fortunei]